MKKQFAVSSISFFVIVLSCLAGTSQALADTSTVKFETQAIDLDTGTITEQTPGVFLR